MDVMARRRAIMAHIARLVKKIISSVTGLVSFVTNVEEPTKVICTFPPVQSGTGDPSPDNERPISGWDGCEIGHTRKNLFDGTVTNARIQNGVVVATGSYRLSEYIRVNPDTSYALVDKDGNLSQIFAHFFDENKTFLQSITTTEGIVVSPAGASYMRFHVTSIAFGDQKPFMLFEGSTATAYEPYQGETVQINWKLPDEYQEVEYLEANKKQYFWADIPIQDGLTVDAVQSFNAGDTFLFGGHADESNQNRSAFNGMYAGKIQGSYPKGYYTVGSGLKGGNRAVYHVVTTHSGGNRTVYIDDVLVSSASGANTVTETGAPCCVFANRALKAVGEDEVNLSYAYSGRVYSLKVFKENALLADYVPCYRKADIKPGMYDLVTGTFYVNQGTGDDFTVGPDASTLPGTVYGGTVTLNEDGSVDLVADTTIVDLGDYPFSQYGSSNHCWTGQIRPMSYVINNNPVVCCEEYKVLGPQSILSNGKNLAIWAYNAPNNARVIIRNDSFIGESGTYDIAALNNSLSGVHMCCRMKTPITYHFDNIGQLQSFLGTNNIWHNMNGDITVEYWNKQ